MIQTSLTKVKINEVVESQIPEVIGDNNSYLIQFMATTKTTSPFPKRARWVGGV